MYSGLSAILYNALKIDLDRYSLRLYVCGMVICLAVGFFDEVIQFFLPNRVFDWRDVIINFASSVTAFMVIRFNILRSS
jgi:VanZ family protein